ncbi:MAG: NRDE family protein [Rhodospirillaceae bacterium]
MCTLVILRSPGQDWPVLLAANRDEMADRPWLGPARHWPDRPDLVAGLDSLAGGSWLGLNDSGVVAAILNRSGTLGPSEGRRSRGEPVLEALDHADAKAAASALRHLNPRAYRPFNLVVADERDAFCLYHRDPEGRQPIELIRLPEGLSMITAFDRNDPADPRIRQALPRFERAARPDPARGDWHDWQALLASRTPAPDSGPGSGPGSALCFSTAGGFGTGSGALIALPTRERVNALRPVWLFAAGPPDCTPWQSVDIS